MKSLKLCIDFNDQPQIVEMLRIYAARAGLTQKAVLINALEAFFSDKLESSFLLSSADASFREWNNDDDRVYDTL